MNEDNLIIDGFKSPILLLTTANVIQTVGLKRALEILEHIPADKAVSLLASQED